MICRLWRGWTRPGDAEAYERYLRHDLLPRVERELRNQGFLGFQLLLLDRGTEVEFVTQLWFESLDAVQAFAGEHYETPVLSETAKRLLSRYASTCDHYSLSTARFPGRTSDPSSDAERSTGLIPHERNEHLLSNGPVTTDAFRSADGAGARAGGWMPSSSGSPTGDSYLPRTPGA